MRHIANNMLRRIFTKPKTYLYIGLVLCYILAVATVPRGGYDNGFWFSWAVELSDNKLANIYLDPRINNNPLILFALWLFSRIFNNPITIATNIYLFKAVPLLFDFLTIVLILRVLERKKDDLQKIFLVVGNLAFWYNSVIWGQVDAVYTFFIATALIAATNNRVAWTAVLFTLAVNVKLQAAIVAPILLVCLYPVLRKCPKVAITGIMSVIATQAIVLFPFMLGGTLPETIHALITRSVDYYPFVSNAAFNIWHIILSGDPSVISDAVTFLGLSYKLWGLLFFTCAFAAILYPIASRRFKGATIPLEIASLTTGLAFLAFFFFNTQMHERYAHPAILFFGLFGLLSRSYGPYILVSIAYVLNLESVMENATTLGFGHIYDTMIFSPKFAAILYAVALVWSFTMLYRHARPFGPQPSSPRILINKT